MSRRQLDTVSTAAHLNGSPGYNTLAASSHHDRYHHHSSTPRSMPKHHSQLPPTHRQREYITARPTRDINHSLPPELYTHRPPTSHTITYHSRPDRTFSSGPPHYPRPHRSAAHSPPSPPSPPSPKYETRPPKPKRPVEIHNTDDARQRSGMGKSGVGATTDNPRYGRREQGRRRTSDPELLEFARRTRRPQAGPPKRVRFSV